ncbi:MAG: hypothetical protein CM15mV10_2430 [uncultured marine virus]|nr:MAG: hypothetical protein CM15mV10_2430 [uncultured marine virus]
MGTDGVAGGLDDGTEYTTGKTTSGSAGDGANGYVQYDFLPTQTQLQHTTTMMVAQELHLTPTTVVQTEFYKLAQTSPITVFGHMMFMEHGQLLIHSLLVDLLIL